MGLFSKVAKAVGKSLPMDETSRMQRAKEQGFDVDTPLYHGTHSDFDSFSKEGTEQNFGGAQSAFGHFLTDNPKYAERFSKQAYNGQKGGSNIMPVFARGKLKEMDIKVLDDLERLGSDDNWEIARTAPQRAQEIVDKLKAEGYDGVRFVGVSGPGFGVANEIAIFDPSNIRGKFAKFDPSQSHSSKLLAAVPAAIGVGGLLALSKRQQEAA
jgi:hypothetical protein